MKKLLATLVPFALVIVLSSCGGKNTGNNNTNNMDYADYNGVWAEEDLSWDYGGSILDVLVEDSRMTLQYTLVGSAPYSRTAIISKDIPISEIEKGTVSFDFDDDSWGTAGSMTIKFLDNEIKGEIYDTYYDVIPIWGVSDMEFSLVRNENAYEELIYTEEEYYEKYPDSNMTGAISTDSPYSENTFISYACQTFDECAVLDHKAGVNEYGNQYHDILFLGKLEYECFSVNVEGHYLLECIDGIWYDSCYFNSVTNDWSNLIGTWRYRDQTVNMGAGNYSVDMAIEVSNIKQVGGKNLECTYSGEYYVYDKTSSCVDVDEASVPKTISPTFTTKTEMIWGQEVEVPYFMNFLRLPWMSNSTMNVKVSSYDGMYTDQIHAESYEYFVKDVSDRDLQDAMSNLKNMN